MNSEIPEDFDGFITPEGEKVSIEDTDRMLALIIKGTENAGKVAGTLRELALDCFGNFHFEAGCAYIEKALSLIETPDEKAICLLEMGLGRENSGNYKAAVEAYSRAFELPQEKNEIWYFLNNNLAYCLNQERLYMQAEKHCRVAIEIE